MIFSDGLTTFELKHIGESVGFLELVYEYIQIKKCILLDAGTEEIDEFWNLYYSSKSEADVLVVFDLSGELLYTKTATDLRSEIRKYKISII